jgi:SAM-dependent methyltransferase
VRFVQAELPPESLGRFDAISAFDVLDHVADPRAMLDRLASLLTPHGELIAVVPVYDGPFGLAQRLLNDIPTRRHRLSRQAWLELIGNSFEVQDWTGIFRLLPPTGPYVHVPTHALRAAAPAILVRARPKR